MPSTPTGSVTFVPRGKNKSSRSVITVSYVVNYWKKQNTDGQTYPFGIYEPQGSATGQKIVGSPKWKDNDNQEYIKSVSLDRNTRTYTYGKIHYLKGKWLIGNEGDASGWWEGSEPSKTTDVIFYFKTKSGIPVTGQDKTIKFNGYAAGSEKQMIYVGEVAIWR